MPRDAGLWDPQLAQNKENYKSLRWVEDQKVYGKEWGRYVIRDSVDLRKVGNTTFLKTRPGEDGHWHLKGGAIHLAELFAKLGCMSTVAELMLWNYNGPTLFRKREHAWGSIDVRAAGAQRKCTYGRPGHRSDVCKP